MARQEADTVAGLQRLVVDFAHRRGWQNDPKNLAMSVAVEAAELMEIYQWKSTGEGLSRAEKEALSLECADVFWYLMRLCEAEGIDLGQALQTKAAINETRFPPKASAGG